MPGGPGILPGGPPRVVVDEVDLAVEVPAHVPPLGKADHVAVAALLVLLVGHADVGAGGATAAAGRRHDAIVERRG